MERIPPQSIESEKQILGTMLLSPESVPLVISEVLSGDFYYQKHAVIFKAMTDLFKRHGNIDSVLLTQELKDCGTIDQCGGYVGIMELTNIVSCRATIKNHCDIVKDKSKARNIIAVATAAVDGCFEGHQVKEIIGNLGNAFIEASRENQSNSSSVPDIVEQLMLDIKGRQDGSIDNLGTMTGFTDIDSILGGLQKQDLVIVAGRPSMGKTTLAMDMVTNVASSGKKVLVFSLEMSKEKLVEKQISSISGVLIKAIQRGLLSETTWKLVRRAAATVSKFSVTIDDSSSLDISQIQARAKMRAMRAGVDLIVVDYLQLCRAKAEGREREGSEISAGLKALAKDLKVPVIALSQLSRKCEAREDKRPLMSDLRDSGSIEQDADVIIFVCRDEVYNTKGGNPARGTAEILIRKNRCGETGMVKLGFDGSICRFNDLARNKSEEITSW